MHYEKCGSGVFQNHPCPRPPPRVNPRAFDFFENFHPSSPVCWHFRWSNTPPAGASKKRHIAHPPATIQQFSHCQTVHSNVRKYPTKDNRNILRSLGKLFYAAEVCSFQSNCSLQQVHGLFQRLLDAPTNQYTCRSNDP